MNLGEQTLLIVLCSSSVEVVKNHQAFDVLVDIAS